MGEDTNIEIEMLILFREGYTRAERRVATRQEGLDWAGIERRQDAIIPPKEEGHGARI